MPKSDESANKIEVLCESMLGRPALVRIDHLEYTAFDHDLNTIPILEESANQLLLKDLPKKIAITPCKRVQFLDGTATNLDTPLTPSQFEGIAPFRIQYLGPNKAGIIFKWFCTKDFWNNNFGYQWALQHVRKTVLARRKSLSNIQFHRFIDHDYVAGIEFATSIRSSSVETIVKSAYEISESIHSMIASSIQLQKEEVWNEPKFVRNTFIPLLKNLGFQNVVFHHGPREFGRDVLFSRQTEFGIPEYWAAQVKLGNVSGKSNSYIDLIVNQAQDAFKIPLHDIQTKSKLWISKFVVAITGRFTENAATKICDKIESHSLRNNIIFLDGDKIQELMNPRMRRK